MPGKPHILFLCALAAAHTGGAAQGTAATDFDRTIAAAKQAMMADPGEALKVVAKARNFAAALEDPSAASRATATAEWLEGEALTRLNRPSDALPVLQDAIGRVGSASRSKLTADLLLARGSAEAATGDVRPALVDFQDAYSINMALGEVRSAAKALQSIGDIYSEAGDDERSLRYYSQVSEVYRGDPNFDLATHNNVGETLRRLGRNVEAEQQFRLALREARSLRSPFLEARILTNLASAQLARGLLREADGSTDRALTALKSGDEEGWRPFIWGVKAQIAHRRGDLPGARRAVEQTFQGVDLKASPPPFRDFHETAYQVYSRLGRYPLALEHLAALRRLDEEARQLTASNSSALLAARFDFANQNLRISRLKEQQIRKDAMLERSKARLHNVVLTVLLCAGALIIMLLIAASLLLRRSRNRVKAANVSLMAANASLQKALRVKTEFLATTSHEIRTPLNGILGMTQVLLADGKLDHSVRERIEVVNSAGETMRTLVNDILDVAKIESGKLTLERNVFDLHALVTDVARLWADQCRSRGLQFSVELGDAPQWIDEDQARLRQILFNLTANAVKFTHEGGVRLTCGVEAEKLSIAVTDSGIGIAEADLQIIFESFRQVDSSTARRYGGTGLGLSISKQLAKAMGGDLRVTSVQGEGSTFQLLVPLRGAAPQDEPAPAEQGSPCAAVLSGATLLIVEPNPLLQRTIAAALAPRAGTIVCVADTSQALHRLVETPSIHHVLADASKADNLPELVDETVKMGAKITLLYDPAAVGSDFLRLTGAQIVAKPISAVELGAALASAYVPDAARSPFPATPAAAA